MPAAHRIAVLFAAALALAVRPSLGRTQTASVGAATQFREVVDETGRTIRIPREVRRIVSLAPSLTETVYSLGLQDRLVGDTDYCDYPPDAQKKTKVGGVINPNLEEVAALKPDLVLVTKGANRLETVNALAMLGIPSYATDPHTVDSILSSTQKLADVLGASEAGRSLVSGLAERLNETQERVKNLPPRRVLFVVWTEPLISVGKGTFIADALRYAGATNIVASPQDWPQLDLEEAVRLQPEFLVFAESHPHVSRSDFDRLSVLPGWRMLDALKNRRYAVVSEGVERPSPRIVDAIEDLARQLHPEAYGPAAPAEKDGASAPRVPGATAVALLRGDSIDANIAAAAGGSRADSSSQECSCAR